MSAGSELIPAHNIEHIRIYIPGNPAGRSPHLISPLKGKTAIIANPVAGGGAGHAKLRELLGILRTKKIDFETFITQNPGHGTQLGAEIKDKDFDCLLVLGGDGTISEVARGFYGAKIPVATVPCGSGNDLAGTLGIPRDLNQAVEVLLNADFTTIDLFRDQGELYTETIGCGFVADVVNAVCRLSRIFHGPVAYFAGVFDTISRFKASRYTIKIDDWEWEGDASLVIINNTWRVGGGMKLTPEAVLDDGMLDMAIFTSTSRLTLLSLLPKVYSGAHVNSPHIIIRRGRKFQVDADRELIKTADGEIIGTLPIDVNIIPGAMKFFKRRE